MDLPRDLELPLASGARWWYWLGGRPAVDFVNTQRERWWRNVETLVSGEDLSRWLVQAQLLGESAPAGPDHLLAARRLRDAIDAGIQSAIGGTPAAAPAITEINRWLSHARTQQRLELDDTHGVAVLAEAPPSDPLHHALARLAQDAAVMLGTEQRRRLRVCASETCSARFYDASRAATRRWCSMSACGNTAKARRHRARDSNAAAPHRSPSMA
jgi:predicted RNA-binding Zn ribbon-like protein